MALFEDFSDLKLYECYSDSMLNIDLIYNHPDCDRSFYTDMGEYVDITPIREQKELYSEMLKKAIRMGYRIVGLKDCDKDDLVINMLLQEEFCKRKINIHGRDFDGIKYPMPESPKYINEILATNDFGDGDIDYCLQRFDYPVRKACQILNRKGYITYWSSANELDIKYRNGDVIKDKNVAYILIDSNCLSNELKERLYLDGRCDFWGVAISHADNEGKYYGIWAEITSPMMRCDELSEVLASKALALPKINKVNDLDENRQKKR